MHFKHTPSLQSVSNKLDLSLPPSRFSEDITNVNDLCSQGRRRLAAEFGGAQGKLSCSLHFFSSGPMDHDKCRFCTAIPLSSLGSVRRYENLLHFLCLSRQASRYPLFTPMRAFNLGMSGELTFKRCVSVSVCVNGRLFYRMQALFSCPQRGTVLRLMCFKQNPHFPGPCFFFLLKPIF